MKKKTLYLAIDPDGYYLETERGRLVYKDTKNEYPNKLIAKGRKKGYRVSLKKVWE